MERVSSAAANPLPRRHQRRIEDARSNAVLLQHSRRHQGLQRRIRLHLRDLLAVGTSDYCASKNVSTWARGWPVSSERRMISHRFAMESHNSTGQGEKVMAQPPVQRPPQQSYESLE